MPVFILPVLVQDPTVATSLSNFPVGAVYNMILAVCTTMLGILFGIDIGSPEKAYTPMTSGKRLAETYKSARVTRLSWIVHILRLLCSAPNLAYPVFDNTFILDTDASAYGIGAK